MPKLNSRTWFSKLMQVFYQDSPELRKPLSFLQVQRPMSSVQFPKYCNVFHLDWASPVLIMVSFIVSESSVASPSPSLQKTGTQIPGTNLLIDFWSRCMAMEEWRTTQCVCSQGWAFFPDSKINPCSLDSNQMATYATTTFSARLEWSMELRPATKGSWFSLEYIPQSCSC